MPRHRLALVAVLGASLGVGASCARSDKHPPAGLSAAGAGDVVAEVGGERITLAEVDRRAAGSLDRIRNEEYEIRRQALEEVVFERALEREASARRMSKEALLKAEVDDRVPRPSRKEIADLYERNRGRFGGRTLEELAPDLERSLREQRLAERRAVFRQQLREKVEVRIALAAPRTEVAIPKEAPSLGSADAPVTLVEFLDYQCPYCRRVQTVVDDLLSRYRGKVRFVHREFLLGSPRALPAARAARCAGEQRRFWEYHRGLLVEAGDMSDEDLRRRAAALGLDGQAFSACLASDRHDASIREAVEQGAELGVSGTPTFFINGRRLVGIRSPEEFREVIDSELRGAS